MMKLKQLKWLANQILELMNLKIILKRMIYHKKNIIYFKQIEYIGL